MRIKSGASVHSNDGEKIGRVRGVVMTPGSDAITGIIVERGFLFTEDRMIPTDWVVQTSEDGNLRLSEELQTFENLERFDEDEYVPGDTANPLYVGLPSIYYHYGAPAYLPHLADMGRSVGEADVMVEEPVVGIDEGDITLRVGIDVISRDDYQIGKVDEIIICAPDNRISHFVVSKGVLFTTRKLIPIGWIAELDTDHLSLAVSRDFMERLPDFDDRQLENVAEEYLDEYSADVDEDIVLQSDETVSPDEDPLEDAPDRFVDPPPVEDPVYPDPLIDPPPVEDPIYPDPRIRPPPVGDPLGPNVPRPREWDPPGTGIDEVPTRPKPEINPGYQPEIKSLR